jgi:hypothetical protein
MMSRISSRNFGFGEKAHLMEIPLNPPLEKGDFGSPLYERGAGGISRESGYSEERKIRRGNFSRSLL